MIVGHIWLRLPWTLGCHLTPVMVEGALSQPVLHWASREAP
jgi:hypothetical protein